MRKLISLRLIVFLAVAIGMLSWLYSKSTAVEPEKHLAFVSGMRSIKQMDANLNQDALRARYNLLVHYDPFVATLDQLHAHSSPFTQEPFTSYLQDLDPRLQKQISALKATIDAKTTLIEQFKSRNAVLKNSLRYFPTLTTQLLGQSKRTQQARLNEAVNRIEQALLILNLTEDNDLEQAIRTEIKQLHSLLPQLSPDLTAETRTLILHTETILITKHEVDALVDSILAAPLQSTVSALSLAYDESNGQAMRYSSIYRSLLYLFSVLLLAYVFYAIVRAKLTALALVKINNKLRKEVAERQQAQAKLGISREIIDYAKDAIALLDPQLRFTELNAAHQRLIELDRSLIGESLIPLLSADDAQQLMRALDATGGFHGEITYHLQDGKSVDVELSLFALRKDQTVQHYVTILHDISERKAYLSELEYQATHDLLTGLPNRALLYRTLDDLFHNRTTTTVGLLILDLDRFKEINDTLGHQAGDLVLRQVAVCITSVVQEHGLVTRLGGDEFAVMLPNAKDSAEILSYATRILTALRQPMRLMELTIEVGGSIGISLYPEHGNNTSQLMRCADVAMYLAKGNGIGYALYEPSLDQHTPRRLSIMTSLGQAIEQSQLSLHFQPKLRLGTGLVSSFEALVRWNHPEHGMIPPDQFIPLAEMSDLIGPLTLWVVDHAMLQIKQWRSQGYEGSVAVNFSARNFLDDHLPQKITECLEKHALPANCFELEITESAMMADPTRSLQIMRRIKDLGFRLSIDDYGTGQSSLAYLQQLPIHSLKIDLSFVRTMLASKESEVIVHSTIQLAHNLGFNVIAEGVEDEATLTKLQDLECDEAQGYFISRPMPAEQASAWLAQKGCIQVQHTLSGAHSTIR